MLQRKYIYLSDLDLEPPVCKIYPLLPFRQFQSSHASAARQAENYGDC